MHFAVVTVFPGMLAAIKEYGVTGRAVRTGQLEITGVNPRDFAVDRHRSVDDRPYGGGPGMVMRPEPLARALDHARACVATAGADAQGPLGSGAGRGGEASSTRVPVLYLSPQGKRFNDREARRLATLPGAVLLAGRYEGVDERLLEQEVDAELSIGDYVLSGGELGAMVVIDAVARFLPGLLGHEASAEQDSFANGLLDCPHFTRPEEYRGASVPPVLLSGDHAAIRRWRLGQALLRTQARRPDLLRVVAKTRGFSKEELGLLEEFGVTPTDGDAQ